MHITELRLINFRNYEKAAIELTSGINVFLGPNGAGKTNLLDALHYMSITKSGMASSDQENIKHDASFFNVTAKIEAEGSMHDIKCICQEHKKKQFVVDDSEYKKLSDHIGRFPNVLIQPTDTDLIRGSATLRRRFFDMLISQFDRIYLDSLIRYNQTLRQRNKLLREVNRGQRLDKSLLEVYDAILLKEAKLIYRRRHEFMQLFLEEFTTEYSQISGKEETVEIDYQSELSDPDFEESFHASLQDDIRRERTLKGVHKDDYQFKIHGYPVKKEGSQGQQKSFVISLKLAMFKSLLNQKGFKPLLFMDDIFDKLDDDRMRHILEMINRGEFGQVFITDARPERTSGLLEELKLDSSIFRIHNGKITEEK
jgi:DNA replication and repair protein RecF